MPWPPKAVLLLTVAYALSPVDFLPDWEPLIGVLDDATVITLGVALATRLVPREIMAEHRGIAASTFLAGRARFWRSCLMVSAIWLVLTSLVTFLVVELIRSRFN